MILIGRNAIRLFRTNSSFTSSILNHNNVFPSIRHYSTTSNSKFNKKRIGGDDKQYDKNKRDKREKLTTTIKNEDDHQLQWKGFERDDSIKPEAIEFVYGELGDKFFVINKPRGYPIQSNLNQSIESILLDQLKQERDILVKKVEANPNLYKKDPRARKKLVNLNAVFDQDKPRLYFPQRLDKWTQGLMIVSLTGSLQAILSDSMSTWVKKYRLMVDLPKCFGESNNQQRCCIISPHIKGDKIIDFSKPGFLKSKGIIKSFLGPKQSPVLGFKGTFTTQVVNNNNVDGSSETITTTKDKILCQYCKENGYSQLDKHPLVPFELLHGSCQSKGQNKYGARESSTSYELNEKSTSKAIFQVELLTGRTHQIRVHFSESGLPITGDFYYNPYFIKDIQDGKDVSNISGLHLQSYFLEFLNPSDQKRVQVEIDQPKEWKFE
ncbi:hypothetical protein CYY_009823 [Polysphondylium violaceum]|uniref:Pseudouridine synthase RsuA/RluA-like domain-containing protein n=1 Tax=Polysphondylium violaceum TaxID=133409 RepID=A0A8J4PKU2_9MYCE|nr:hypothetical protein CYY_009823 [Polysphondylium violaceum]